MSSQQSSRPLDGIRVLDLTANVAGPLACQVLADLGAHVVKIEPPAGEAARRITTTIPGIEHITPYFSPNNRGKQSVRLELGSPEGAAAFRKLVKQADVVVQGMRPGTMERHGLGPDDVSAVNERCIYASLAAYGGGSPLEDRPGIDMTVQAESGCLSAQSSDHAPRLIPFQLVDSATGHVLAQAVLGALLHRERFGVVNRVDVSLYDVACSLAANYITLQMNLPASTSTQAPTGRRAVAVEPSGVFPASDGHLVLAAYVPAHWRRFVTVLGRHELLDDPRFADQAARSSNSAALRKVLEQVLSTKTTDEWVELLTAAGLMAARINTWSEVVRSELFDRRGLRARAVQDGRDIEVLATPARYSTFTAADVTALPALGEHETELLSSAEDTVDRVRA
ncbi:CaiB/BaiF CoA transferase family protein [Rhodococcus tibetensis]|uniref:CoA transferase n=1 Tax=Rhodococcus tibetensis TaxID=2965064 RepID=A0ABT1QIH3_9NOCA|nr:CoA transferase [Rhodococcus sp. FXJ9.536]MCQ4122093.1 CoA transferase [Rhodococcus sp. FXJ9.536]